MMKTLTLLNERGDTTLAWDEDSDERMIALIDQKMKEGMTFFLLKPRAVASLPPLKTKLKKAKEALPERAVVLSDADFAAMLTSGAATTADAPSGDLETVGTAKTGKEAVRHGTVAGAKPLKGG